MDFSAVRIPESINKIIGRRDFSLDGMGMSGSQVLCFEDMVLKIEPVCDNSDSEHTMMEWLRGRLPVPEVLAFEQSNGLNFLLMSRVQGRMLCSEDILENGQLLTDLMAQALRMLWAVDISGCPCDASIQHKLELAGRRVAEGLCSVDDAEPDTYGPGGFASPEQLYQWLCDNRPEERPVLSHGDFCLPNIFTDGRRITGFIDLGRSGGSDMHQDLALGTRSLKSNLDGRYGGKVYPAVDPQRLYDALGITPDAELMRYYTLLDELF